MAGTGDAGPALVRLAGASRHVILLTAGLWGQWLRQQSWRASSGWKWGPMRFWKWACVGGAVFACAVLLAGKDDMIRYGKMRRM
jgi:hypothetical protein